VLDTQARLRDISIWFAHWHCQGGSAKNFSEAYHIGGQSEFLDTHHSLGGL
jgi:hypothetical protein